METAAKVIIHLRIRFWFLDDSRKIILSRDAVAEPAAALAGRFVG